jgi:hypothetical protein
MVHVAAQNTMDISDTCSLLNGMFGGTYGPYWICKNNPNHRFKTNKAPKFNTVYRSINTVVRTYIFSHVWGQYDIKNCK